MMKSIRRCLVRKLLLEIEGLGVEREVPGGQGLETGNLSEKLCNTFFQVSSLNFSILSKSSNIDIITNN